jgi:hypothetical protein
MDQSLQVACAVGPQSGPYLADDLVEKILGDGMRLVEAGLKFRTRLKVKKAVVRRQQLVDCGRKIRCRMMQIAP